MGGGHASWMLLILSMFCVQFAEIFVSLRLQLQ